MLPNCSEYKRRLLRLKTLGPDFELARTVTQQPDKKSGSATGQQSGSMLHSKEKITCQRTSSSKYDSSELWMRRNPRKHHRRRESRSRRRGSKSAVARVLKLAPLQQPLLTSTVSDDAESDMETKTYLDSQTSLLDCQTNNSRRGGAGAAATSFGRRGGVTTAVNNANSARSPDLLDFYDDDFHDRESTSESELEAQNSNAASSEEISNENAVAKGANALVKQATSRQTEIIDTSKLLEEGKVETQYEEPEEPEVIEETDHKLIDEYEKTFAYARRLRALLNMQFQVMDRGSLETNFLLVKAHEHPTQKVINRWRNVDLGSPYDGQIRQQKLIDDFKATCASKKGPKKGEVRIETYPEWVKFYFRFRKDNSDKRWTDYIAYRQRMKKASGGKLTVPKPAEKYMPINYDVWSTSIVVFAKPTTNLQTMIDPVFSKLGLVARADFKYTIGCFVGDTRTGKCKIPGGPTNPEEVTMQATCAQLYKRNCNEVFVNDNRIDMFKAFPTFYRTAVKKNPEEDAAGDKKGKKGKKDKKDKKDKKGKKGEKNQSNLESESEPALEPIGAPTKCVRSSGGKSTKSEATESRQGDTVCARLPAAVEEFEEGSSPSATNQNLSVHDCDSSDEYDSQPTVEGANTTTKSGRSETTRRDSLVG